MRYSWNLEKNNLNLKRHGIAFEDARRIFEGPTVEQIDDRFEYSEIRVYAIGLVNDLEITVIYTDKNDEERRIISAWKAEPHEKRYYWKKFKECCGNGLGESSKKERRRRPRSC